MLASTDLTQVIERQPRAAANLVYLGDKLVLWNPERTAFLMYAVQGRSVIAFGDPVGPEDTAPQLIAQFIALCDRVGLMPVFYETSRNHLGTLGNHGLTALKIGEEARVRLSRFSLEGSTFKTLRNATARLARDGFSFRMITPRDVHGVMSELQDVSDDWLARKGVAEKRFSVGYFKPEYIERFPVAAMTRDGRIVAFVTMWTTADEISLDLTRHRGDAPSGTMDALLAQLMMWGRDQGYRWCNLGMAPLAGVAGSSSGPWTRVADFVYRHGETFYNFRGVRAYKEKFHPEWQPKYLVYPGGLTLARALADVAALVAGSYRGIFMRVWPRVA